VKLLETQTRDNVVPAGAAFIAEIRAALDSLKGAPA
jgi:tryptophan synthase alpha chain